MYEWACFKSISNYELHESYIEWLESKGMHEDQTIETGGSGRGQEKAYIEALLRLPVASTTCTSATSTTTRCIHKSVYAAVRKALTDDCPLQSSYR